MLEETLEKQLKELIRKYSVIKIDLEDIKYESNLINDLGFDSISIIKLVTDIENVFKVQFDDKSLDLSFIGVYGFLKSYILDKLTSEAV